MDLFCQESGCGERLSEADELRLLEQGKSFRCSACGAVFKQGGMTLDEFAAWLAFPPANAAA